jgi:hypothetical protein
MNPGLPVPSPITCRTNFFRSNVKQVMAAILGLLIFYLGIQLLLLAVSLVIGVGLHWCFPAMNIGTGILIGLLSSIASAYCVLKVMRAASDDGVDLFGDTGEEQEEEESEACLALPPETKRRQRRRSKKN